MPASWLTCLFRFHLCIEHGVCKRYHFFVFVSSVYLFLETLKLSICQHSFVVEILSQKFMFFLSFFPKTFLDILRNCWKQMLAPCANVGMSRFLFLFCIVFHRGLFTKSFVIFKLLPV